MPIEHFPRTPWRRLAGAARTGCLALTAAACAVGPTYHRPDVAVPDAWSAQGSTTRDGQVQSRTTSAAADEGDWWSIFHDPTLNTLVQQAAHDNLDVQQAALRIEQARAQRDATSAAYYPSVNGTGLAGRARMSENGIAKALSGSQAGAAPPPASFNLFQLGFDATWELDLFGRVRRNVEAADADVRAAQEARADALVSMTAEIARAYFNMRGYEAERDIAAADLQTEQRLQTLVASRNRAGFAPDSDVAAQQVRVSSARATIPKFEQNIALARNRLAFLLALPPGAVTAMLGTSALPPLPPEVPTGMPGDLLRRRPDIRQREAQLAGATARVGVAEAALFPSVTLGLTGGLQSTTSSNLFDWASRFLIGGADVSVPIFQGGRLRAQVRIADTQAKTAVLAYRETVLNAFHDVDNALITYATDQRRVADTREQLRNALRSRDLATARYKSGLSAYTEVLDAEREAHQAQQSLADVQVTAVTDLVALFKALGGGWQGAGARAVAAMSHER